MLIAGSFILLLVADLGEVFADQAAHQSSIKLFDAVPTFRTEAATSPAHAIPYASTSLTLSFAPGDKAVISSTPDGTGPIVIDDFMTINGVNICEGVEGQILESSGFGPIINPTLPAGGQIEAVLTPIPPIDVSGFIPRGTTEVLFELRDFGVIAGNTNLFLVTTATATRVQPSTVIAAFDTAMGLFGGQLRGAVEEAYQVAFQEQVSRPVIKGLRKAHGTPKQIARVKRQLAQASAQGASEAAASMASLLDGQTLINKLQRNLGKVVQDPATQPTSLENFVANVGAPTIKINQSINDILAFGFDPEKVEFEWKDISATTSFTQEGEPQPVSAEIKPTGSVTATRNPDGTGKIKGEGGVSIKGTQGEVAVTGSLEVNTNGDSTTAVSVKATPDLSRPGIIVLWATVIAIGTLRRKPAASRAA